MRLHIEQKTKVHHRYGAGAKTTLSKKLGQKLRMPVVSRDEIKEGYVNTFGVKHDRLPPETDRFVTDFFFDVVFQFLAGKISLITEAAFQQSAWEWRMPKILEPSHPFFIVCSIDAEIAAERHLQRGLINPRREFYHEDKRVSLYRATGNMGTPQPYVAPNFDVPTLQVLIENDYSPSLDEIQPKSNRKTPERAKEFVQRGSEIYHGNTSKDARTSLI